MEQLGKVINQVTKFVQERVPFPLGEQIHEFTPGDQVWVKDWKHDLLAPQWKGPYTVILTAPTAVKVAGIAPGVHHTRVKRANDADPENAQWTAQRGPPTLGRPRSPLRRRRKRRSRMSPFRMKPHDRLLLLGLINVHIPTQTSQYLQLLGMWGYASVCDGWTSLVGVTAPPRRF